MKVVALGGGGDMGRMAVTALLSCPQVSAITIADKNYEAAKIFANLIGSDKLRVVEINVTDQEKLLDLISQHDLVLNTVGPFLKFGKLILETVIKAGKPYVDICDDWKPTLELLDLNEAAKKAGVTAIIGIGASPGVSNLLAVLACSELDEVDEVLVGWGLGSTKSGQKPPYFVSKNKILKHLKNSSEKASAAILHLLYESMGKIPTYRDRQVIEIEALTEITPLKFPGGGKGIYACHVGHPEPLTLSRTLKARSIANVMYLGKRLTDILRDYVKKIVDKQITIIEAAIAIERRLNQFSTRFYLFLWLLKRLFKLPPEICVTVTGKKDGMRKMVAMGMKYRPYGEIDEGMDGITAIPVAIAALMILENKITKKGVLTPEESIDPNEFFDRYAGFCQRNFTKKDILIKNIVTL